VRIWAAAAADVLAIGLFATLGRASHAESLGLLGIAQTAWPFVVGWALGVLIARAWRQPFSAGTGLVLWLTTVLGGMLLRLLTGDTAAWAFVIVASVTLAVLLLGWRGVYALVMRARTRNVSRAPG
jgi:hypothetical protein